MYATKFLIHTTKEVPSDAELVSHKLMVRSGMIKKLGSGLYSYLPFGLKVLKKIEDIIRSEMNNSGSIELLMPSVQPSKLWEDSGRWDVFGPQMLKIKDRHDNNYCYGPTHEEVIVDISKEVLKSYKSLPINLYQIQTKFRDEIRPRYGVMRAREFIMKDAYSFHESLESLENEYQNMHDTYSKIFNRIGLTFKVVEADSGAIGGSKSHEFHVLAESGEDFLVYSDDNDVAMNLEMAPTSEIKYESSDSPKKLELVKTEKIKTVEKLSNFLSVNKKEIVKTIIYINEKDEVFAAVIRGDLDVNETKLRIISKSNHLGLLDNQETLDKLQIIRGFVGPINLNSNVKIYIDLSIKNLKNFIVGANKIDHHFLNANISDIDPENYQFCDIRNIQEGENLPGYLSPVKVRKGIEVGHIFQLGDKYSKALNAAFQNKDGKNQNPIMGCYGIGVSRIMAASIEQNNDANGIIWPKSIAPFDCVITPIGFHVNDEVSSICTNLYLNLKSQGIDVILDDRNKRIGFMLSDWDLIGIPIRILISPKTIANNECEIKVRSESESKIINLDKLDDFLNE
ncbi:MAG: proline--tRNA ligase [Hydrogenophilales bacterium]